MGKWGSRPTCSEASVSLQGPQVGAAALLFLEELAGRSQRYAQHQMQQEWCSSESLLEPKAGGIGSV